DVLGGLGRWPQLRAPEEARAERIERLTAAIPGRRGHGAEAERRRDELDVRPRTGERGCQLVVVRRREGGRIGDDDAHAPRVVRLLVRTWNAFHGNALPPERRAFLADAVRLACADAPDILLLQELPVWSLRHLHDWSGMIAVGDVARRPMLGPLPSTAEIGRVLTELNHGLLRSAFTGQANAVLVREPLRVRDRRHLVLNTLSFRRRFDVGVASQVAWAKERRG